MGNSNLYSKSHREKVVDTINIGGKYVDREALTQRIITAATTSVFAVSFITFLILLLS
ncbi:hypothetical protein [Butyrivibrio sp. XPD2006]|uniref:hypothetical protein n=1 Tax=Butyrivibrio sp. XPD2006 TaxID=1280668 RepID=UPI0003B3A9B5|nr:hypothetical protein [Butyrivibrio sp. XPD2006]